MFQISFYSLDMKKGIDVCYPLSTITIPKLFSEVGHLKLMIENFWSLRVRFVIRILQLYIFISNLIILLPL
jgi:hypothetical protein